MEHICMAIKEEGGLGVRSLKDFNVAILGKWSWRVRVENGLGGGAFTPVAAVTVPGAAAARERR